MSEQEQLSSEDQMLLDKVMELKDKTKGATKEQFREYLNELRYTVALSTINQHKDIHIEGTLEEATPERLEEIFDKMGLKVHVGKDGNEYTVYTKEYGGANVIVDTVKVIAQMRALLTIYDGKFCNLLHIDRMYMHLWQKLNNTQENPFTPDTDIVKLAAKESGIDIDKLEKEIEEEIKTRSLN